MIENKIENSGLIQLDLQDYIPKGERVVIDLKDFLYEGIMLREKDFREKIGTTDWSQYQDKFVALTNTADAIIPLWAYMLLSSSLQPYVKVLIRGNKSHLEGALLRIAIESIDAEKFRDGKVIVKGCGKLHVPESAYMSITLKLQPVVKSLMFGEACSTVPVFKKK
ncbi:MAG: DUF2480 family protein [Flavobacteriales bacterium]